MKEAKKEANSKWLYAHPFSILIIIILVVVVVGQYGNIFCSLAIFVWNK